MWETTVIAERSELVDAAQAAVFSLLADSRVWSLSPGFFAFDVTVPPGFGRLRCLLGTSDGGVGCDVLEVCDETPGQMISFRTRSTVPPGRQIYTFSARPEESRVKVTMMVQHVVGRGSRVHAEAYWGEKLKAWLREFRAAVESRRSWPDAGMPADLQQTAAVPKVMKKPMAVSAAVLINAPPDSVWEAVYAPESSRMMDPEHVLCAGHVPGTAKRQVGEMQYHIQRSPDGRLWAAIMAVIELVPGRTAVVQDVHQPHGQMSHVLTPVAQGTRLELEARLPARTAKRTDAMAAVGKQLQAELKSLKSVIEQSSG